MIDESGGSHGMGQHSDKARESLLDAAEELFARYGIDAVSNRKITEHAGTANHSAITYHFGSREELLRALLSRHLEQMRKLREQRLTTLGDAPELRDLIAYRFLPWIDLLAAQPVPGWRARFLFQARSVPSVAAVLAQSLADHEGFDELTARMNVILVDIPPSVLNARSSILAPLLMGICSDYEGQVQDGTARGSWQSMGYFLIDAIVGMLAAPVTHPGDYLPPTAEPDLI